jgi:L-seryl-tRNA(Ser) seleniumtransferase
LLIEVARESVAAWRREETADPEKTARKLVAGLARLRPGRVINATGVLLHTNLGRAPVHPLAAEAASHAATSYAALEFDLESGGRGRRGAYAERLAATVTGADAALIVNNNAGALLLAMAALAGGREVVVSRGEQIEIGGSFRLPEVIAASGARAVEVGTTNRTRARDYARAIGPATGALLKVHPSNFRIDGFAEEAGYGELAAMAREHGIPLVADIGSGLLDERVPWLDGPPPEWLEGEPGARQTIERGADLVLFSGDKLLGGPQAGVIVGRADLVARVRSHPLARAVRIGGPALASLAASFELYGSGRGAEIPFWRMAAVPAGHLETRCRRVLEDSGVDGEVVNSLSVPGAGTAPGRGIPGPAIALGGSGAWKRLLDRSPPVIARQEDGRVLIDLRAVDEADDPTVAEALAHACR